MTPSDHQFKCESCGDRKHTYRGQVRGICKKCYRKTDEYRAHRQAVRAARLCDPAGHAAKMKRTRMAAEARRIRATELHRIRKFGLDRAAWSALFVSQGNACAICRSTETKPGRGGHPQWHTDHDHATGKVRGILCHSCNTGIGLLRDDAGLLEAAAAYLRRSKD